MKTPGPGNHKGMPGPVSIECCSGQPCPHYIGLVDCRPNYSGREAIAANVAADSDISSIGKVREAKETGDEEREIGWFGSRSLDVRR